MVMRRRKVSRRTTSGRRGVPRVSRSTQLEIRLEKQNFDVRPTLYTLYTEGGNDGRGGRSTTVAGDKELGFSVVPLHDLCNDANIFNNAIAKQYTQYRLKKATCHFMLLDIFFSGGLSPTDIGFGLGNDYIKSNNAIPGANYDQTYAMGTIIMSTAWTRSATYQPSGTYEPVVASIATLPQCKQWCWNLSCIEKPEFWTSITAGNGDESNWLTCVGGSPAAVIQPATPPNTGRYFCPQLAVVMSGLPTTTGTARVSVSWAIEEEFIVECRGSRGQ